MVRGATAAGGRDASSAQPGAIAFERLPSVVRTDWVQNSNDSFWYTHPQQRFAAISPLVGDASLTRPRTRASHIEIAELLAGGKVTPQRIAQQVFANHNLVARLVLPDLLAACAAAPDADTRDGCAALGGWNRRNDPEARGAHLFREFWRQARGVRRIWRVAFDPAQPVATPHGLRMDDDQVRAAVWKALGDAVRAVRVAGFALDAPLSTVLRSVHGQPPIGLHGGDEYTGVLNNIGQVADAPIGPARGGGRLWHQLYPGGGLRRTRSAGRCAAELRPERAPGVAARHRPDPGVRRTPLAAPALPRGGRGRPAPGRTAAPAALISPAARPPAPAG
jgi:acyl-homoserine-lactone acylase